MPSSFLEAEDLAALGMEDPAGYELIDPGAGFEVGVELDQGVGPEQAVVQLLLNVLGRCAGP